MPHHDLSERRAPRPAHPSRSRTHPARPPLPKGHGWLGCSREYQVPALLNADYGEPTELCKETATGSGIFTRKWTKADIAMDCNTWTPTITLH